MENPVDWHIETEEPQKPIRVYHFWRKVVKTALVLGHDNAEVKRVFSESGKSVTDDRIRLSEASINGIRATSDGLKTFKCPGSVPITKQLLQQGRSAHAHYAMHLEKEQKEKQEAQKQLTLQREQALQMEAQKQQLNKEKKESERQDSMEVGDTILKEANAKLQAALKNKDFKEVSVAQGSKEDQYC